LLDRLRVVTVNGEEAGLQPGSVYEILPGHDAWVVGREPFISMELSQETVAKYAKER